MKSLPTPLPPPPREPQPPAPQGSAHREPAALRPRLVLAALLYTLLALWLLWPLSATMSRRLYDANTFTGAFLNEGDVPLTGWIVAWGAHSIGEGNLRGLFDANTFHPEPHAL